MSSQLLRLACCCNTEEGPPPGDGDCYTVSGYEGRYYWGTTPAVEAGQPYWSSGTEAGEPQPENWEWKIKCHKLLVWSPIAVTSNTIPSDIGAPRYVLHSTRRFNRSTGVPFYSDFPTNTTFLDTPPYWFSGCGVGGYSLTTIAHYPTGAQLNTMWGGSPIADGNYNLLVGVRAWRHYTGFGAPTYGVTDIVDVTNGRFRVVYLALQSID